MLASRKHRFSQIEMIGTQLMVHKHEIKGARIETERKVPMKGLYLFEKRSREDTHRIPYLLA